MTVRYKIDGAREDIDDLIYATHPAAPGTALIVPLADGSHNQTDVVLWGVLADGTAVPITLGGVWDGISNQGMFVMHPSGRCGNYDANWNTLAEALDEVVPALP